MNSCVPHVNEALDDLVISPINRADLAIFAGASGDLNRMHIDIDFARKAGAPDVFVHGMLVMAWLGRMLTRWRPQSKLKRFDVRFQGITQLGNAIRCSGRVAELVYVDGQQCARIELAAANQYGQTKLVGEALVTL